MRRIALLVGFVAAFAACQTANLAAAVPAPPEGYVVTPHGLVHRSCVRTLAPGERIDASGVVTHATGEREQLPQCRYDRLDLHTLRPIKSVITGWVATPSYLVPSPNAVGSLSATFVVPPAPKATGATVFFFPGAGPADGSTVIQPVLQYGVSGVGLGGNYWAAASWFCCPAGWSHHSALIPVNAGDTIVGMMSAVCSGTLCNWGILTSDTTTGASTLLPAENVPTPFVWAFGGALEAYSLTKCNQYPPSGTITFTKIGLWNQGGTPLSPTWTARVPGGTPNCGYSITSTPTTATIKY